MSPTDLPSIDELLRRHGLAEATPTPFPNDGWSGASMTLLERGPDRFVLKRDSLARDWIARATRDGPVLREAWFAAEGPPLPSPVRNPAVGAAHDPATGESAVLMPDLRGVLFDWNAAIAIADLDRVLEALAVLHAHPWDPTLRSSVPAWTPWRERLSLICRSSLERPGPARDAVAERLLSGWDAWDRLATPGARSVIGALSHDPQPLLDALATERSTLLHGDLKLANVGIASDGAVEIVDWQMVMMAPVAIELGWFLVSNVNALPRPAPDVLDRYRSAVDGTADRPYDDWPRTESMAVLVGLLLRGWRKGYDVDAGVTLASGVSARDDLAWWCERAVEAADRLF